MEEFKSPNAGQGITDEAFERAAQGLTCEVAALKAVADVESRGAGFLKDGRPKILFERHIFRRLTSSQYDKKHPEISGPAGGYKGGVYEYDRLEQAMALDYDAALKSASWGKFQIMGFNHLLCMAVDVKEFVRAMVESEDSQLEMFVKFLKGTGLIRHLRNHDWEAFAKGYNGPGYRENRYHTKLEAAYTKYAKGETA